MIDQEQVKATVEQASAVRAHLRAKGCTEGAVGPLGADLADLHEAAGHLRDLIAVLLATPPYQRDRLGDTLADLQVELEHLQWHAKSALPYVEAIAEQFDD